MSFPFILDQYRTQSTSTHQQGERFERLMQAFLKTDPQYAHRFQHVWLWEEFPYRNSLGGQDTGIDIVCKTFEGEYWAVQCKCYQETTVIDKSHVDSFLATSSRKFQGAEGLEGFAHRLWISTSNKWGPNAEEALVNQNPPVSRLTTWNLEDSPIDWEKLDHGITGDEARTTRKTPRSHQVQAIEGTREGFKLADRGKLIMACGTGKTFTSLCVAEDQTQHRGFVLFLVPSIALLGQTLREWTSDAQHPIRPICVCSDSRITKKYSKNDDLDVFKTIDLALPATTNTSEVARQMRYELQRKDEGMTVVFSTYQSIEVVIEAQKKLQEGREEGFGRFDLVICDEAHRTTGVTVKGEESSTFTKVHDEELLDAKKRLYMTATPRLYDESSKQKAEEDDAVLCSMDDPELYGEEFYRIGFGEAVESGLLSDYKVLILTLNENDVPLGIQNMVASKDTEINADDAAKLIGCINALSKRIVGDDGSIKATDPLPMKKAVAFCSNIAVSKRITETFNTAGEAYLEELSDSESRGMVSVSSNHIDGAMNAPQRDELMSWLRSTSGDENECRILTNVRCLSEGVDVPSLDAVLFLSPRNSQVDVVQSVGRVMRRAPGKNYGYIVIPVVVPSDVSPERALEDNERFKVVWTVLNALRAHDDRFNATVNKIDLNKRKPDNILVGRPEQLFDDDGNMVRESVGKYGDLSKQLSLHFEELQSAVYARLVKKVGDRQYWEQWAQSVGEIAERQTKRIASLVEKDASHSRAFDSFMTGLHKNINPSISKEEAIEMLSQHIITRPVFDALFEGYSFVENNPVSVAMQDMLDKLEEQAFDKDAESLTRFYDSVRKRAAGIDNAEGKQRIIIELYDKFFKTAFPKLVEKLGIVYTPVEVVDYIVHSVDDLLKQEFGKSLSSEGVHVLDPFTGTGTFITRILQSGLIKPEDLKRKYTQELHANEIVLLAYYIAAINAENAYHDLLVEGEAYVPFDGICLTDTFQLGEADGTGTLYSDMFPKNSSRVEAQKKSKIQVIVGNPPYSVGQGSANDNAQNQDYPILDSKVEHSYAERSVATNKNSLYDSYIKAFKWSSERLDPEQGGIIGFVTNGSWIDGNAQDGMRKCLAEEFTSIYVFNLRGNQRTSGERSRQEGGKIFGSGSRTPVSICFLVKNPKVKVGKATIYYRDIGDYLTREEKLTIVSSAGSMLSKEMKWKVIKPNNAGDWINQRSEAFETMIPLGDKKGKSEKTAFKNSTYGRGLETGRDAFVFSSSSNVLSHNIRVSIEFYKSELQRYEKLSPSERILDWLNKDSSKISWSARFQEDFKSGKPKTFDASRIFPALYRPFMKQRLYFSPEQNNRTGFWPYAFPKRDTENRVIAISGTGGSKPFSCLMVDRVSELHFQENSQCFPLWYWEDENAGDLFATSGKQCGLTDWFIDEGKKRFGQDVTPEDLFYYIYGLLHTKSYRETFESDVKKVLARVTLDVTKEQYEALRDAGKKLGDLHVNYESVPPHPDVMVYGDEWENFRVEKLKHPKKGQTDQIIYNGQITISNIPKEAYEYEVNGRSAIAWLLDRYQVKTDKKSGITNDPNDWAEEVGNPRYILDLILSVIHVSTKTVDIVNSLPEIDFD